MDQVWAAVSIGEVDCGILTSETTHTGLVEIAPHLVNREHPLYVFGELVVPYRCMLLGKPGTHLEAIKLVLGHGSLKQCSSFFKEQMPDVEVRIHRQNSLAAATEVLEGDGTIAVVGTEHSARENGLSVLVQDVDRGSEGAWWLLTRAPYVSPQPDVVIVGKRSGDGNLLGELICRMHFHGFGLRSIAAVNLDRIFEYGHLLVFTGGPCAVPPSQLVEGFTDCWLIGAFESTPATR